MACRNCGSKNTWDDISAWGCNNCGWCSSRMLDRSGKSQRDKEDEDDNWNKRNDIEDGKPHG